MNKRIVVFAFAFALAAAFALPGCGGSSDGSGSSDEGSGSSIVSSAGSNVSETAEVEAEAAAQAEAQAEYDRATALFDEGKFYSAKEAFENSGYGDWQERAAACVQPMPATGEIWHNPDMVSDEMQLSLVVESSDEGVGRYIELYTEDATTAAIVFVNGVGAVDLSLPGGNYYIREAAGTEWYGEGELFGRDGTYSDMVFDEFEGDRYLTALDAGYAWSITINTSSGDGQSVSSEGRDWESFM